MRTESVRPGVTRVPTPAYLAGRDAELGTSVGSVRLVHDEDAPGGGLHGPRHDLLISMSGLRLMRVSVDCGRDIGTTPNKRR